MFADLIAITATSEIAECITCMLAHVGTAGICTHCCNYDFDSTAGNDVHLQTPHHTTAFQKTNDRGDGLRNLRGGKHKSHVVVRVIGAGRTELDSLLDAMFARARHTLSATPSLPTCVFAAAIMTGMPPTAPMTAW
jgi:hypothetical protein